LVTQVTCRETRKREFSKTYRERKSEEPTTVVLANLLIKRLGVRIPSSAQRVDSISKADSVSKCVVTFKVQEPKPKKGKQPKATKSVKTLVVP
jgi:hypothetical protein